MGYALDCPNTETADISFGRRWPNRERKQSKVVVVPFYKPSREALIVQAATALEKKTGKYVNLVDVRTILSTLHKDFLK